MLICLFDSRHQMSFSFLHPDAFIAAPLDAIMPFFADAYAPPVAAPPALHAPPRRVASPSPFMPECAAHSSVPQRYATADAFASCAFQDGTRRCSSVEQR